MTKQHLSATWRQSLALILALVLTVMTTFVGLPAEEASADLSDEVEAAAEELETLGEELAEKQESLATATEELEQTDYEIGVLELEIEDTEAELAESQEVLADTMRSAYKTGTASLLDLILGAADIDDLVSRVYYLDKISEQEEEAIEAVRTIQEELDAELTELEEQQATQETLVANLESEVADYQERVAEATEIYESLDEELQAELAAIAAAEAEAAAEDEDEDSTSALAVAVEAIETSEAQAQYLETAEDDDETDEDVEEDEEDSSSATSTTTTPDVTEEEDDSSSSSSSSSAGTSTSVSEAVALAYAQLGKPYVYGTAGPDTFDCSGLVYYCYGSARGRSTSAMIASLKASGDWTTDLSELSYGDLIFTSSGHVGIYLGDGTFIHAANPTSGVVIGTVSASGFYGGGSYF